MYDCIGDVHGCTKELRNLLTKLGYAQTTLPSGAELWHHDTRKVIFLGDLNDRGPDSLGSIWLAMNMWRAGKALCILGNHDDKLRRALKPNSKVTPGHGLSETLAQLDRECPDWLRDEIVDFLESLPWQLSLDDGKLQVSHAGLPEKYHGKDTGKARSHALYGDVDGSKDENGLPNRKDWAQDYRGQAIVVHGHTPMRQHRNLNNVWCIDQGVPFGGKLTCLRYPEMEIVQVDALDNYQPFKVF